MHMIFTEEEKEWIETRKFGWPIKDGCPKDIRESIEKKKKKIDNQRVLNGNTVDDKILQK